MLNKCRKLGEVIHPLFVFRPVASVEFFITVRMLFADIVIVPESEILLFLLLLFLSALLIPPTQVAFQLQLVLNS